MLPRAFGYGYSRYAARARSCRAPPVATLARGRAAGHPVTAAVDVTPSPQCRHGFFVFGSARVLCGTANPPPLLSVVSAVVTLFLSPPPLSLPPSPSVPPSVPSLYFFFAPTSRPSLPPYAYCSGYRARTIYYCYYNTVRL